MVLTFATLDGTVRVLPITRHPGTGATLVFFAPDDDETRWRDGPFAGLGKVWVFEVLVSEGMNLKLRDHTEKRFTLTLRENPALFERLYLYVDLENALRKQARDLVAQMAALGDTLSSATTYHGLVRAGYDQLHPGLVSGKMRSSRT